MFFTLAGLGAVVWGLYSGAVALAPSCAARADAHARASSGTTFGPLLVFMPLIAFSEGSRNVT